MSFHNSKFAYAMMNDYALTANGAVSLKSPDYSGVSSGRITLFFKCIRGLNVPQQYQYMVNSNNESVVDTFLLAFHIRDCRGGKGEREIGRRCMIWLFINHPKLFSNVVKLLPDYGRWDDLLQFFPGVLDLSEIDHVRANYMSKIPTQEHLNILHTLQNQIVEFFCKTIKEDLDNMNNGKPCSLAAKWAPTEGDSLDKKFGVFKTFALIMKVSPRTLRKKYITPLRSYLKIVERYMCNNEWDKIDYNKVPSCAMFRLKKSFEKNDQTRFQEWRDLLKKNDPKISKINAKQLYPHQLIKEMRENGSADSVCEAQWKVMEDECMKNGALDDDIVVVDTSSSMHSPNYLPLDVACSIGLLISKCSTGKFKNHVISFNTTPSFHIIDNTSIYQRYRQLIEIDWGGSTNLQATFEMILSRAKKYNLINEDMPKRLWIISDMQFDQVNGYGNMTNFEIIDKMYTDSNYTRPQIIFWNVNGSSNDFPVSVSDKGTVLISGFSPIIMKSILNGGNLSPYDIMRNTLESERLLSVRNALGVEYKDETKDNK
jgi:hypothetical protein